MSKTTKRRRRKAPPQDLMDDLATLSKYLGSMAKKKTDLATLAAVNLVDKIAAKVRQL